MSNNASRGLVQGSVVWNTLAVVAFAVMLWFVAKHMLFTPVSTWKLVLSAALSYAFCYVAAKEALPKRDDRLEVCRRHLFQGDLAIASFAVFVIVIGRWGASLWPWF